MDGDSWIHILVIIVILLIILKGFFTACEYAAIEASDSKIKNLARKDRRYKRLSDILSKPTRMITAFTAGRVGFDILIGSAVFLASYKVFTLLPSRTAVVWRVVISAAVMICSAVLVTALTEIIPKKLVGKKPDKFAARASRLIRLCIYVLYPFGALAYGISKLLCLPFGIKIQQNEETVTEEEIRMMVDAGNETGVIEESQREMINNIFDFGDVNVSDVMTHRKDVVAIDVNAKIGDIVYLAINKGYSRIPVFEKNIDSIIGIIYVKDLLCLVGCERSEDFTIKQFMRKAVYLPETCMCSDAFEELTKKRCQCAIVVDEYGGTAGLVSLEDMLEEIVGNIQDEYDDEKADISEIDKGTYIISGDADPEDVREVMSFSLPEDHNYDTMSAFIVDRLGRIPEEDETPNIIYDNIEFTVLISEDNWISKIKAVKLPEKTEEI